MTAVQEMELDQLYDRAAELRREFGNLSEGQRSRSEVQAMIDEVESIDSQITLGELENRRSAQHLAATTGGSTAGHRSGAELLYEDSGWRDFVGKVARGLNVDLEPVELKVGIDRFVNVGRPGGLWTPGGGGESGTRATLTEWASGGPPNYDTTGAGNLLPVGQPIPPIPRQARLFLRDLLPKMSTTLAAIPYVQELNPTAYESASAVAEGGTKPNATLSFQGAKADPTVIAATLVISKQLFEDSPAVVQYINQRLPYIVKYKEDNELLNGSGTWPDIQGILNTTGIQTQGVVNTDNAQTFGAAFADVENHDGTPTGVVLNPFNAWKMFTNRAAGGSGTFDAGTPFSALPLTVWGVPTYRTRAITEDTALVGDFELGGMLIDREQVNVETYRERYAEVNAILLVCEERMSAAWFRPDLFVNVTGLSH